MAEHLTPESFVESYGPDAAVLVGKDMQITLGQALLAEQAFCPADSDKRQDPAKRLQYLAGMLAAAGSLRPEDQHLLGEA